VQLDTAQVIQLHRRVRAVLDECDQLTFRELVDRTPVLLDALLPAVRVRTVYENDFAGGFTRLQHGFAPEPNDSLTYVLTFPGPPEPLQFNAYGFTGSPEELVTTDLFFRGLRQLLATAGYREALDLQARRDWLTGLPVQKRLEAALDAQSSHTAPSALLAARLPAGQPEEELERRLGRLRKFAHSLRLNLPEEAAAYLTEEEVVLVRCPDRALPHVEKLVHRLAPEAQTAYALSGEAGGGKSLITLACSRLDGWRTGITGSPAPWARAAQLPLTIHCREPLIRTLLEQRTSDWRFEAPLTLLADFPQGAALQELPGLPGPVAVLTDSTSVPYLSDLNDLTPAGLIAGQGFLELRPQLERIATGEKLYAGPPLELPGLFPRERQVWRLLAYGHSNSDIARKLNIGERTAANYYSGLRDKLQLDSRHAVALSYWGRSDNA